MAVTPEEAKRRRTAVEEGMAAGWNWGAIAADLGIPKSTLVAWWKTNGDCAKVKKSLADEPETSQERYNRLAAGRVIVPKKTFNRLMPHASRRGISPEQLAGAILEAVLDEEGAIDRIVGRP